MSPPHYPGQRRVPCIAWIAAFALSLPDSVYAFHNSPIVPSPNQTTSAPAPKFVGMSHEDLFKEAAKTPLVTVELTSVSGKPLTDAEKADLKSINELLSASSTARRQGDYKGAAVSAVKARRLQETVLGKNHALTTVTAKEAMTLALMSRASPVNQQEFAEADQQTEVAQAAAWRGDFSASRTAASKALDIRERVLGKEHAELIPVLRVLGNAQIELHSLDEAQKLLLRALTLAESNYGRDHPETAWVLDRLGWLKICQGEYREAAEHLRRAVWIIQQVQGNTAETAESLDNLGTALVLSGDREEALQSKLRSLFIREKLLGPEAKDTGTSLANLAWLYGRIGKRDEVVGLHKKALAIFEKALGPDHRDTITELCNLAHSYCAAEKYNEAAELYEKQVARDEKQTASQNAGPAERLTMLGAVYLKLGKQSNAEQALQRSFDQCVKLYDSGERSIAIRELLRIVDVYDRNRMLEDAAKIRETIWKRGESEDTHPTAETIQGHSRLGQLYSDLGRPKEALEILTKAVGQAKQEFGEGDLETLEPLLSLSVAYEKLYQPSEAVRICEQALLVAESKLGNGSPQGIYALYLLGRFQLQQKKFEIAGFSLQDCLDQIKLAKLKDPALEARVLRELAFCKWSQGKKDDSSKLFRQSIDAARETSSTDNPYHKAELAASIHRFLEAVEQGLPLASPDRDALRAELRGILERLHAANALDADNKKWLQEQSLERHNK